eukprot:m.114256 g.114256  ORF g.114256 m.114256 type:complete len:869 (+) comp14415_c0_seq2:225-2831(+)
MEDPARLCVSNTQRGLLFSHDAQHDPEDLDVQERLAFEEEMKSFLPTQTFPCAATPPQDGHSPCFSDRSEPRLLPVAKCLSESSSFWSHYQFVDFVNGCTSTAPAPPHFVSLATQVDQVIALSDFQTCGLDRESTRFLSPIERFANTETQCSLLASVLQAGMNSDTSWKARATPTSPKAGHFGLHSSTPVDSGILSRLSLSFAFERARAETYAQPLQALTPLVIHSLWTHMTPAPGLQADASRSVITCLSKIPTSIGQQLVPLVVIVMGPLNQQSKSRLDAIACQSIQLCSSEISCCPLLLGIVVSSRSMQADCYGYTRLVDDRNTLLKHHLFEASGVESMAKMLAATQHFTNTIWLQGLPQRVHDLPQPLPESRLQVIEVAGHALLGHYFDPELEACDTSEKGADVDDGSQSQHECFVADDVSEDPEESLNDDRNAPSEHTHHDRDSLYESTDVEDSAEDRDAPAAHDDDSDRDAPREYTCDYDSLDESTEDEDSADDRDAPSPARAYTCDDSTSLGESIDDRDVSEENDDADDTFARRKPRFAERREFKLIDNRFRQQLHGNARALRRANVDLYEDGRVHLGWSQATDRGRNTLLCLFSYRHVRGEQFATCGDHFVAAAVALCRLHLHGLAHGDVCSGNIIFNVLSAEDLHNDDQLRAAATATLVDFDSTGLHAFDCYPSSTSSKVRDAMHVRHPDATFGSPLSCWHDWFGLIRLVMQYRVRSACLGYPLRSPPTAPADACPLHPVAVDAHALDSAAAAAAVPHPPHPAAAAPHPHPPHPAAAAGDTPHATLAAPHFSQPAASAPHPPHPSGAPHAAAPDPVAAAMARANALLGVFSKSPIVLHHHLVALLQAFELLRGLHVEPIP